VTILTTPDNELLPRGRELDGQALAGIYDRYAPAIYRYLYRYLGDAAQAEDLTSEVFMRLVQVLNTPRAPRDHLQGWLFRVAHNLATDWYRREARMVSVNVEDVSLSVGSSPQELAVEHQTRQHLRSALRELTPEQQQVILLRFGEGLRVKEVSRMMGKSEGAIKILQHRGLKRLRKILLQKG
jgi:RNA polymerase sigma-70 factor, ECF subfamily